MPDKKYLVTTRKALFSQTMQSTSGAPLFATLQVEPLGIRSLVFGGIASLLVCGSILSLPGSGKTQSVVYAGRFQPSPGLPDTIPAPPATVTISWLPEKPISGSTAAITVRVTSERNPPPTGKVRIYDGVTLLNLGDLQDGTVTVTRKLPYMRNHLLRATYLGDAYHSPVSSVATKAFDR